MENMFRNYLINMGYKEYTLSGNPSTVYDYIRRIDFICREEGNISWYELMNKINIVLPKYDVYGEKEHLGDKSHNAVINALRRFNEAIKAEVFITAIE